MGSTRQNRRTTKVWNAWTRSCKKVDSQGEHFTSIHDRFLGDPVYRESQLAIGWTEPKVQRNGRTCRRKPHVSSPLQKKLKKYQGQWYLTLNKSSKNGPMRLRPDFRAAVSFKNRLHRESSEQVAEPISPQQYRRWHPSSSASWWDMSEWNWT